MQYTLRNIPEKVDQLLRQKAKEQGRSLNEIAVEALSLGAGVTESGNAPIKRRDLSDIAGTYSCDPGFEQAMKEQDEVDPRDWE